MKFESKQRLSIKKKKKKKNAFENVDNMLI